jgi:hypothetical protein
MKKQNYFSRELASLQDNDFLNFDDAYHADDFEAQTHLNAAAAPAAPTSQPYIFSVQNTTSLDIQNVEVLNAFQNFITYDAATGKAGANYLLTYNLTGVTYQEFLMSIMSGGFSVGNTRLEGTSTQVLSAITITTKDINASRVDKTFVPEINPMQYQATVIDIPYNYLINGFTAITIATLYANATLKIKLYPALRVSQINQLSGGNVVTQFSRPNVALSTNNKAING